MTEEEEKKKNHLRLQTALTHSAGWSFNSMQAVRRLNGGKAGQTNRLFLQHNINLPVIVIVDRC